MHVHSDVTKIKKNYYIALWDVKKNAYDEETMNKTEAFDLFSKFKSGVTSATDAAHLQNLSPNKTHTELWHALRNLPTKQMQHYP